MKLSNIFSNGMILGAVLVAGLAQASGRDGNGGGGGGGNNNDSGRVISKSSQAGMLLEATEHTLRLMTLANSQVPAQVKDLSARFIDAANTAEVFVTQNDNSKVRALCSLVDDVSRGGTIIKKEFRCQIL